MRTKILGDIYSFEFELTASVDQTMDPDSYITIHPDLMTRAVYNSVFCAIRDALNNQNTDKLHLEFRLLKYDSLDDEVSLKALASILRNWSVDHSLSSLDPDFVL